MEKIRYLLISLVPQSPFFETWEAGLLMDADTVILPNVLATEIDCLQKHNWLLGQGRDQRSWSAKLLNSLYFCILYVLKRKKRPDIGTFLCVLC